MARPIRVFVSYVREDLPMVARLVAELRDHGIHVWFDRDSLLPGIFWRDEIRKVIRDQDYFLACFSCRQSARQRSYMNEELQLAIGEIRLRGNAPWFIPILFSGDIPDIDIGPGRSIRDIQCVRLTKQNWTHGTGLILRAVGHPAMRPTRRRQGQTSPPDHAITHAGRWRWSSLAAAVSAALFTALGLYTQLFIVSPLRAELSRQVIRQVALHRGSADVREFRTDSPDVTLEFEIPAKLPLGNYEISIVRLGGTRRTIFTANAPQITSNAPLTIAIPHRTLGSGKYELIVYKRSGGSFAQVATYSFKVAEASAPSSPQAYKTREAVRASLRPT